MARALIIIARDSDREKVARWAVKAPWNSRVEFKPPKRTLPQNDKMWAALTDVANQVEWYGQHLSTEDWKDMFTASLRKARVVPGLDPGSFVLLGLHTSDMGKGELSDLIELIHAFGANHGVTFHEPAEVAA